MAQKLSDIIDSTRPALNPLMEWMWAHSTATITLIVLGFIIAAILWLLLPSARVRRAHPVGWWLHFTSALTLTAATIVIFGSSLLLPEKEETAQQQALIAYSSQTYDIDLPAEVAQAIVTQQDETEVRDYAFLPTPEEADRLGVSILSYQVLSDDSLILLGDGEVIEPAK